MENKTNLSILHCVFFIYQAFASGSESHLLDSEKKTIAKFMFRWAGQNKEKMNEIIHETLFWSQKNIKTINDQIGTMISMVEFLKTQKDFNILRREYFLMDIRNIARSDGDFLEEQKKWHDIIAKALDVEIRISPETHKNIEASLKKVKRKKIGFRRSK